MSMLDAVSSLMTKVNAQSRDLEKTITDASQKQDTVDANGNTIAAISDQEMLGLNFQLGQYNAMMEATSNITKSTTDMLKTLAQRSN